MSGIRGEPVSNVTNPHFRKEIAGETSVEEKPSLVFRVLLLAVAVLLILVFLYGGHLVGFSGHGHAAVRCCGDDR